MKMKIWQNARCYQVCTDNPAVMKKLAQTYERFEYIGVTTWS